MLSLNNVIAKMRQQPSRSHVIADATEVSLHVGWDKAEMFTEPAFAGGWGGAIKPMAGPFIQAFLESHRMGYETSCSTPCLG